MVWIRFPAGLLVRRDVWLGLIDLDLAGVCLEARDGLLKIVSPPERDPDLWPPPRPVTDADRNWLKAHRAQVLGVAGVRAPGGATIICRICRGTELITEEESR